MENSPILARNPGRQATALTALEVLTEVPKKASSPPIVGHQRFDSARRLYFGDVITNTRILPTAPHLGETIEEWVLRLRQCDSFQMLSLLGGGIFHVVGCKRLTGEAPSAGGVGDGNAV